MDNNQDTDEVMTTVEAAKFLKCSRQQLELWRMKGQGPSYSRIGRMIRYRRSVLLRYLADQDVRTGKPNGEIKEREPVSE